MANYLDTGAIQKRLQGRVWPLVAAFAIPALLLVGRLFSLQIVHHDLYVELSRDNKLISERLAGYRGVITDRHGVILAESRAAFSLMLMPDQFRVSKHDRRHAEEVEALIARVASLMEDDPENIRKFLRQWKGRDQFFYQPYKRDLTWEQMSRIEEAHLPPAYASVVTDPVRDYPLGKNLSHVLGYVGEVSETELEKLKEKFPDKDYRQGDWTGKAGIEQTFEKELRGVTGYRERIANARGELLDPAQLSEFGIKGEYVPAQSGNSLALTIDAELQAYAWDRMKDTLEGSLVALDPRSGEILAMVDKPGFDPNLFSAGISPAIYQSLLNDPQRPLFSRTVQGRYPPGSTYKIAVAAAGLQEGAIGPNTTFLCTGKKKFGNRDFACWNKNGHGSLSVKKAIQQSCDVFFYNVGTQVGIEKLAFWSEHFGLGHPTGIELPHETSGVNPSPAWKQKVLKQPWYWGELISSSIGQGYTLMSPLQVAKMTSVIASGGRVFRPHLVKTIIPGDGTPAHDIPKDPEEVLKFDKSVIQAVREGLRAVVNEPGGTAVRSASKEIIIAGKTGTAQVSAMELQKKYKEKGEELPYELRDHAWFTAFAPAGDDETPEIVVTTLVEHGEHGSGAAAPVVRDVIEAWKHIKEARLLKASAPPAPASDGERTP